ncbi:type VI secretion system Vgr family protein [Massilia consociata]|uniref:Type VI secretion system Vgr family protein n=1 Tax=Massilia consociata TaxID=760117 RepID=A0ABV6FKZ3_9BURK
MADPTRFFDQALLSQRDRLLKLDTPLGDDILLPQRVLAHDRLGRSYEYTVDLVSVRDDIELKKLIAKPVTLWLRQPDRSYLPVSGYVHTIKRLGSDGQLTFCQMSFAPWLYFLKFRKDARIWQDKAADDILAEVFSAHPQAAGNFRFELIQPAVPRSYCTQYETDWHFVHRLMEEEGWYGYHKQAEDGSGHVFVITDTTYRLPPVPTQQIRFHSAGTEDELQEIGHWSTSRSVAPYQFTTRTDDYKSPNEQKQCNVSVLTEHGELPSQLEVYEYTGAYTYSKREQGDRQARIRVEEWESSMKRFHGVSSVRNLRAGSWFTLEDHPAHREDPEEDRQFVVIALDWCIENNLPVSDKLRDVPGSLSSQVKAFKAAIGRGDAPESKDTGHCFNCFEVQRRKIPFRSPAEHAKPDLHPQTAVVVGPAGEEVHTDRLNRVKVWFRWDRQNPGDDRASCWVRVSYPNAGQGWGGINIPRIGQEVIVTFLNGDVDRPVVTGRLYNEDQIPQWHTDGRLSGFKSKELNGSGFNQLVFDDTTNQNRAHLYSSSTHAQLNLGYLVTQRGNERSRFFGTGFALSTDDFGGIVTNKGLYISTFGRPGAQGTQLDATESTSQLKAAASLAANLSSTASKAGAEPLGGQDALKQFIDATEDRYEGEGQGGANRFKEPVLLAGSPAGIGLASNTGTHVHAGTDVTLSSGMDTNMAVGKSFLASVAEKISLFAYNAGIKLFAAKGKIDIQAQGNDLDIIAEKVLRLLSTTSRIEIHAKEEVTISAGGSSIKINASGITNSTSGKWTAHASMHTMPGPAKTSYVMPHVPKAALEKTDIEFRHLTDWGEPLAGAAYKATLSDGSIRKGTLDAQGIARISDVPAGTAAKIEYDYKPLQASSTVSAELDEDIHELLNWVSSIGVKKGKA